MKAITYSGVVATECVIEGVGFERNEVIRTYGYLFIIKKANIKKSEYFKSFLVGEKRLLDVYCCEESS